MTTLAARTIARRPRSERTLTRAASAPRRSFWVRSASTSASLVKARVGGQTLASARGVDPDFVLTRTFLQRKIRFESQL